jgi:hypothetical protein
VGSTAIAGWDEPQPHRCTFRSDERYQYRESGDLWFLFSLFASLDKSVPAPNSRNATLMIVSPARPIEETAMIQDENWRNLQWRVLYEQVTGVKRWSL